MTDDVKSQNDNIGRGPKDILQLAFRMSVVVLVLKVLLKN